MTFFTPEEMTRIKAVCPEGIPLVRWVHDVVMGAVKKREGHTAESIAVPFTKAEMASLRHTLGLEGATRPKKWLPRMIARQFLAYLAFLKTQGLVPPQEDDA